MKQFKIRSFVKRQGKTTWAVSSYSNRQEAILDGCKIGYAEMLINNKWVPVVTPKDEERKAIVERCLKEVS